MNKFLTILFVLTGFFVNAQDTLVHTIDVSHRQEFFLERSTGRSFTLVQYGYKLNGKHDIMPALIYQTRDGQNATQWILDAYPSYKKGYMFFSARYSNSILFPRFVAIGEIYYNLPKAQEVSFGLRYINAVESSNIYIITGTYGIYYGNWYTFVRPMMNILSDGVGWSGMIVTRRYVGDGKTYFEGTFLKGQDAGTTRPVGAIENSFGLDTWLVRFKANISLKKNWGLSIGTDYSVIDIPPSSNLKIMAVDLGLKKKF